MKYLFISILLSISLNTCFLTNENAPAEFTLAVNPAFFIPDGLAAPISKVPCTLSDGTKTNCYKIITKSLATEHQMGPWCPRHINDNAEAGGVWFGKGVLNNVDGEFIKNLATFYDDEAWKVYNEDGSVRYTATREACAGAAKPDVEEIYQNYCVECLPSYMGEDFSSTYLIPVRPVKKMKSQKVRGRGRIIGLALNGVNFDPPAPIEAILKAHTIAPLDDCGGHVNLHGGYHYHAATGCTKKIPQEDGHAALIGYAMDGFGLYERLDSNDKEPIGLDECSGHFDKIRGYHYHVFPESANQFIGCLKGTYAK